MKNQSKVFKNLKKRMRSITLQLTFFLVSKNSRQNQAMVKDIQD